jgi:hypothetical protein
MGRLCVAGYKIFGCEKLEERCAEWRRMASNSKEGQGPQRAVLPVMMMMMMMMKQTVRKIFLLCFRFYK